MEQLPLFLNLRGRTVVLVGEGEAADAKARLIARAVSVEPVKQTPQTRASRVSAAPTVAPSPGRYCSTSFGMPASCNSCTAA